MKKGFSLIELLIVLSIIAIVISILVPGFIRARNVSRARSCQANLVYIAGAKAQWALENSAEHDTEVFWEDLLDPPEGLRDPYLQYEPFCSAGGEYILNTTGFDPRCTSGLLGHNLESLGKRVSDWTTDEPAEDN